MDCPTVSVRFYRNLFSLVFGALLLAGCGRPVPAPPAAPTVPPPPLVRVSPDQVPAFFDDIGLDALAPAVAQSLNYLNRIAPEQSFWVGGDRYSVADMIRSLEVFQAFLESAPTVGEVARFIRERYRVYRSTGNNGDGRVRFTGYYEPHLRGSRKRGDTYRYPVYAKPDDAVRIDLSEFHPRFAGEQIVARIEDRKVLPYHDREAISYEHQLRGKAEVIAWVDSRVDLFFLHVQGSGKIFLNDGEVINVHYNGSNGRPYRSIGRLLIEEGKIDKEQMSMQEIRQYLEENPEEMRRILTYNPSYVFFRIEEDGPFGALGVRLTPGRSLATDRRLFPDAALVFVETEMPLVDGNGSIAGWTGLHRFMLNQDTGGAIRGADRADIFWGSDSYAELAAGHLRHPGSLYVLVLAPEDP
jgi:membrane-bound lytic murein transglycosylase A